MYVRVEGKSAVLNVKWEQVDVKTAGAYNFYRLLIIYTTFKVKVGIWDLWSSVLPHAAGRQDTKTINTPTRYTLYIHFCSLPTSLLTSNGQKIKTESGCNLAEKDVSQAPYVVLLKVKVQL